VGVPLHEIAHHDDAPLGSLDHTVSRGEHLLLDLFGCRSPLLDDEDGLLDLTADAARAAGATVLSGHHHRFEPHGVSVLCVLAESHISIHTWPETGTATIDIYTCGSQADPAIACRVLEDALEPALVERSRIARGQPTTRATAAGLGVPVGEVVEWLPERITPWDRYEHGATRIVHRSVSEYQEITIAETPAFGRMLLLDGIVQSSECDEFIYHEALVQPAMYATGAPRVALVLGGGEGATIREVLRWPTIERVVMVDIDGDLIGLAREHLGAWHRGAFDDPRTELIVGDAVEYLRTTPERFDVVISDMTDPVEEGPSTFCFTQEYFRAIQRVLAPGGVLAVQAGPWSPSELDLHARVVRTMRTVFAEASSYPCIAAVYGRALGFTIASDVPIRTRVATCSPPSEVSGALAAITPDVAVGLLAPAPFIEAAVAADDRIYTDAAPPATHGAAGWTD
jgi:spermidine synthase